MKLQTTTDTIATNPIEAVEFLQAAGGELREKRERLAFLVVQIGRTVNRIERFKWWVQIERSKPVEGHRNYLSFDDFIQNGLPVLLGYQGRSIYTFRKLARAPVVSNLKDDDLRKMKSVQNVLSLVKIEEGGTEPTPQMIADAKRMPSGEFETRYAVPRQVTAATVPSAGDLRFLVDHLLKPLQAEELQMLRELVEEGLTRCQDVAAELARSIDAAVRAEWAYEDAAQAVQLEPIQTKAEFLNGHAAAEPEPAKFAGEEWG